jgi:hypothetical protein
MSLPFELLSLGHGFASGAVISFKASRRRNVRSQRSFGEVALRYTVRPRNDRGHGSFSVSASEPREALDAAKSMVDRGIKDVEILGADGIPLDLAELEREAAASDASHP